MIKSAARVDDTHECSDEGPCSGADHKIKAGSPNIFINGKPAARVGDPISCKQEDPTQIASGSKSVTFNDKAAARQGDPITYGGTINQGSGNVFIGDSGTQVVFGNNTKIEFGNNCIIGLACEGHSDKIKAIIELARTPTNPEDIEEAAPTSINTSSMASTTTEATSSVLPANWSMHVTEFLLAHGVTEEQINKVCATLDRLANNKTMDYLSSTDFRDFGIQLLTLSAMSRAKIAFHVIAKLGEALLPRITAAAETIRCGKTATTVVKEVEGTSNIAEELKIEWPPNDGFLGEPENITLEPETIIDRYGYPKGTYVSPKGTPFEQRALPQDFEETVPYKIYKVKKPIQNVKAGLAAPWFKQPGMGTQYRLPNTVEKLIREGKLEEMIYE